MTLAEAKKKLVGAQVRTEGRMNTAPYGSGAAQMRRWTVVPIVGVTSKTVIVQHQSGRKTSIRLDTGVGAGNNGTVTGLHTDDLAIIREAIR